jgi:hypothetical protein
MLSYLFYIYFFRTTIPHNEILRTGLSENPDFLFSGPECGVAVSPVDRSYIVP